MSDIPATARPFQAPASVGEARLDGIARLVAVIDRLRAPDGGCPWDLEQDATTLATSLVEEAFEAVEAIEEREAAGAPSPASEAPGGAPAAAKADAENGADTETDAENDAGRPVFDLPTDVDAEVRGELGDVLMNIVLIARCEEDAGRFDLGAVANDVADKLIRRHPHVFGGVRVAGTDEVLTNWEAIKRWERAGKQTDASALAGVPKALPALQRAQRLSGKAISAGFRWGDTRGALAKVREELEELEAAFGAGVEPDPAQRAELEAELGDLLMATAIFGKYAGIDAEQALRTSLRRFEARYRHMEAALGGAVAGHDLDAMMRAWGAAKAELD